VDKLIGAISGSAGIGEEFSLGSARFWAVRWAASFECFDASIKPCFRAVARYRFLTVLAEMPSNSPNSLSDLPRLRHST